MSLEEDFGGVDLISVLERSAWMFQRVIVELELQQQQQQQQEHYEQNYDNLLVALRSLATVYATLDDGTNCIEIIDRIRYYKSCKMPFPIEQKQQQKQQTINYNENDGDVDDVDDDDEQEEEDWEWVYSSPVENKVAAVALRTKEPWLNTNEIATIQEAAQNYRQQQQQDGNTVATTSGSYSTTRFTMQYSGNSDLHVADLIRKQPQPQPQQPNSNTVIDDIFHRLLQTKVYPLVRKAFLSSSSSSYQQDVRLRQSPQRLCVYDALIVRHDGDQATQHGRETGASLPLHRDGGLFSVNIALQQQQQQQQQSNHDDDDDHDQWCGGTLFDRLLLQDDDDNDVNEDDHQQQDIKNNNNNKSNHDRTQDAIQNATVRPVGPGYAVVHRSTESHAGAPTKSGIREILVIFLTLRPESPPPTTTTTNPQSEHNHVDDHHQAAAAAAAGQESEKSFLSSSSFEFERGVERSFYLKELVQKQPLPIPTTTRNSKTISRLYRWAVQENPMDGEALFWVSHSQFQIAKNLLQQLQVEMDNFATSGGEERGGGHPEDAASRSSTPLASLQHVIWNSLQSTIKGMERVTKELDPCNVRTLVCLGLVYSIRWGFAQENHSNAFGLKEQEELAKAAAVLQRAVYLTNVYEIVFGSSSSSSGATLLLQIGEVLLRQGRLEKAAFYLRQVPYATKDLPEVTKLELQNAAKEMLQEYS